MQHDAEPPAQRTRREIDIFKERLARLQPRTHEHGRGAFAVDGADAEHPHALWMLAEQRKGGERRNDADGHPAKGERIAAVPKAAQAAAALPADERTRTGISARMHRPPQALQKEDRARSKACSACADEHGMHALTRKRPLGKGEKGRRKERSHGAAHEEHPYKKDAARAHPGTQAPRRQNNGGGQKCAEQPYGVICSRGQRKQRVHDRPRRADERRSNQPQRAHHRSLTAQCEPEQQHIRNKIDEKHIFQIERHVPLRILPIIAEARQRIMKRHADLWRIEACRLLQRRADNTAPLLNMKNRPIRGGTEINMTFLMDRRQLLFILL